MLSKLILFLFAASFVIYQIGAEPEADPEAFALADPGPQPIALAGPEAKVSTHKECKKKCKKSKKKSKKNKKKKKRSKHCRRCYGSQNQGFLPTRDCEIKIEAIGTTKTVLGESPHYDLESNSLYYTDVLGEYQVLRYDLSEDRTYAARIKGEIAYVNNGTSFMGWILPVECCKNIFVIGIGNKIKVIKWDGKSTEADVLGTQLVLSTEVPINSVHNGKVDPSGYLFTETIRSVLCNLNSTDRPGGFFRSNDGQTIERIVSGINVPNGFAFDDMRNMLYLSDSCKGHVIGYDLNPSNGAISNERIVFDFKLNLNERLPYVPDGLTIDADGNIYVVTHGQGIIYKINPITSTVLQTIEIPGIKDLQSLTFGGKNLDTLFVTTDSSTYDIMTGQPLPSIKLPETSGLLYKITGLCAKGLPARKISKKFITSAMNTECKEC